MNLKEILKYGKEELIKNNIEDASIIAKELAEHIFKITRAQMIANNDMEFSKDQTDNYINSIKKISTGIPIQYITNNQEFMNLNFYVDENVLIPQPDTETLVEEVINEYKEKKCEILDLCTGSGAIAISLAKYINESNIVASDISMKALQIAKLNAEKNLVRKKIEFIESDIDTILQKIERKIAKHKFISLAIGMFLVLSSINLYISFLSSSFNSTFSSVSGSTRHSNK